MPRMPDIQKLGARRSPRQTRGQPNIKAAGRGAARGAQAAVQELGNAASSQSQAARLIGKNAEGKAASAGAMTSAVGEGLGKAGQIFAEAQQRIQTRNDAVELARSVDAYKESSAAELRRLATEDDLSKAETGKGYAKGLSVSMQRALSDYQGSEDGKARLAVRLADIRGGLVEKSAILSLGAQRNLAIEVLGKGLNTLTNSVYDDPASLSAAFDSLDEHIDDLAPTMTPEDEIDFVTTGREQIALSAINSYLDRGSFDEAREILANTPGVVDVLSPESQRSLAKRFADFDKAKREARNKGLAERQELESFLGRKATPEELARKADILPKDGAEKKYQSTAGKQLSDEELVKSEFPPNADGTPSQQMKRFAELAKGGGDGSKVAAMRGEFTKLSQTFIKVRDSFRSISELAKRGTPAADNAIITAFAKMNDPNGRVSDADFRIAAAAGSFGARMQTYMQRFASGTIDDSIRQDFLESAEMLFRGRLQGQLDLEDSYRGLAQRAGFPEKDVLTDFITDYRPSLPGAPAAPGGGEEEAEIPEFNIGPDGSIQ